jgi:DDE superfamily endonuclease
VSPIIADDPVVFTCVLEARRETVDFLARLLHQRRRVVGTRSGTRALGPFKHAVLALRWFLDNTRVRQLAADNALGSSTAYAYLHEAIDVLAALAPCVHDALLAAKAAGATHLNLDGTLIHTDRVAMRGPNGADLWWSGKHKDHGGNIQVLSYPDGFPGWVSDVRPGREHDTTCAKKAEDLLPALEFYEAEHQIPTLTDLGYISLSPAIRHPYKKPKGGELTEQQLTYNKVIRGVHGVAERANALLKETFAALQLVSLSPTRIGAITKAALVLLHLEHGRPIPGGYTA